MMRAHGVRMKIFVRMCVGLCVFVCVLFWRRAAVDKVEAGRGGDTEMHTKASGSKSIFHPVTPPSRAMAKI